MEASQDAYRSCIALQKFLADISAARGGGRRSRTWPTGHDELRCGSILIMFGRIKDHGERREYKTDARGDVRPFNQRRCGGDRFLITVTHRVNYSFLKDIHHKN